MEEYTNYSYNKDAFRKYVERGLNKSIKISGGACVAC